MPEMSENERYVRERWKSVREREIAEVEEEIEIIEAIVGLYASHGGNKFRRILAREQAVLAELRRGMKEKP